MTLDFVSTVDRIGFLEISKRHPFKVGFLKPGVTVRDDFLMDRHFLNCDDRMSTFAIKYVEMFGGGSFHRFTLS